MAISVHPKPRSAMKIRQVDVDLATMDRGWVGNPYLDHFVTAINHGFPDGERLFVNALKAHIGQIHDPDLRAAVRTFIIQEMNHARVYEQSFLAQDLTRVESKSMRAGVKKALDDMQRRLHHRPILLLAFTVAAEHMTAIMGMSVLARPDLVDKLSPALRALTIWHSIEEIEHRSVAFDVYQSVGGTYALRTAVLLLGTLTFFSTMLPRQITLLWRDRQLFNLKAAWDCFRILLGRRGIITGLIPRYFDFFRPNFHPAQLGSDELLAAGEARLAALVPTVSYGERRREAASA